MISKEEFLRQIKNDVFPYLLEEEKRRKRFLLYYRILPFVLSVLILVVEVLVFPLSTFGSGDGLVGACLIGFACIPYFFGKNKLEKYQKFVVTDYAPYIFNLLGIDWNTDLKHPSIMGLKDLGFLPKYHQMSKETGFCIFQDDISVYVKQVKLEVPHKHYTDIVFWGPVICFQIPEKFKTNLMLLNKKNFSFSDEMQGKYAISSSSVNWQETELEDVEFNNKFRIFSSDQIMARRILSPLFMEKLKKIEDAYGAPTNVLFYQNSLILSVNIQSDIFNIFSHNTKVNINQFLKLYNEINALIQLQTFLNIKM